MQLVSFKIWIFDSYASHYGGLLAPFLTKKIMRIKNLYCFWLGIMLFLLHTAVDAQFVPVRTPEGYTYLYQNGQTVSRTGYKGTTHLKADLTVFRKGGQFGYLSRRGLPAIAPEFDVAFEFKGDYAIVGRAGSYYIINKQGKIVDGPFMQPYLPEQSNGYLFKKVGDRYGVLAPSGEWKLKPVFHSIHYSDLGYYLLETAKDSFQVMSTIFTPMHLGYSRLQILNKKDGFILGLQHTTDSTLQWILLGHGAQVRFKQPFDGEAILQCRYLGNHRVYLPKRRKNGYSNDRLIDSRYVYKLNGDKVFPNLVMELDTSWANKHWAKIGNKYIKYKDERHVHGSYLFEDVKVTQPRIPYDLVKHKGSWKVYFSGRDTLYPQKYEQVHRTAFSYRSFVFGRFDEKGKTLWGLADYTGKVLLEPKYNEVDPYWKNRTIGFYSPDSLILVHASGRVEVRSGRGKSKDVKMLSKSDLTTRLVWDTRSGQSIKMEEFSHSIRKQLKKEHGIQLYLSPKFNKKGFPVDRHYVYVGNNDKQESIINTQDGRIEVIMEAFYKDKWMPITHFMNSWCGNSYYNTTLPAQSVWAFELPVFKGEHSVKVRAHLTLKDYPKPAQHYYSNIQYMDINPGQTWIIPEHVSSGLSDPNR